MTTARRDGGLATVALFGALGAAVLTDVALSPVWLLCGALGTIGLEAIAMRYREAVRALWERPVVQVGSLVGVLAGTALAAVYRSRIVVSLLVGGLGAYLCVLVLVSGYRRHSARA
ncbi:hypothetical protein [Natranaeroarchaeum aerophilus]|uniref:Uncharacterized protein n=1 Tax=Natranaeroarchaeum aerophilus TaxID=2917711 RepID=A0AAE3FP14_9EURY|nr:hypothetical protein [Natranaeroarchaeum aerophilus]MCL9812495.1 hypothetical protein [Natranaeroarchaeum aerophilus]